MLSVKVEDRLTPDLRKKLEELRAVPREAHQVFVDNTPVRSGNARRRTRLVGETITADYPYAQRLDRGWSRQKPLGMTKPTIAFLLRRLAQIFKGR